MGYSRKKKTGRGGGEGGGRGVEDILFWPLPPFRFFTLIFGNST